MSNIKLVIGLGNPGPEYEKTRHNVGRNIILSWQKKNAFADFSENKKMFALISEDKLGLPGRGKNKIILTLPETFMNNSGKSVSSLIKFYKIKPDPNNVIIIHDDMDIPIGKIKISINKSAGGHKGVASVLRALKTENVTRFRVGTWKTKKWHDRDLNKLVVAKFSPSEQLQLKKSMKMSGEALTLALTEGIEKTMNEYNSRN